MRLALAQLRKFNMPYTFSEELDLKEELDGFEDIISSKAVKVNGVIDKISGDLYSVTMEISTTLILECAVSLKPVSYDVFTTCVEMYDVDNKQEEDVNIIALQTLDTLDAVVTNIIIAKPMKVIAEGESFISEEEDFVVEEEDKINPAFASLKDLLK